jgi:glycosyltransferase involved in cell wall biosynthesis
MEAVAAGLPIIGFDVRYGNQNFVDEGENGYRISSEGHMDAKDRVRELADRVVRLFTEADIEAFHAHSYEKAREYLSGEVENKWKQTLEAIR